ncbi:MAG: 16S rRNA (adenine(1518)-N(6)/adenine(1519)-N(6))-dimethyltransferase RsmA [bacterium]|nr:16S rRNA (adenine(1518)-N(6)/adenine(1519)-N(6))-dimethyltransferase RsmA [bacterium]
MKIENLKLKIRPNKLLGQNFLVNPHIQEEIVAAGEIGPEDIVIEVGPGTGLLTKPLLSTGAKILAVEKDRQLAELLGESLIDSPNLEIIPEDILQFKPQNYKLEEGQYKVLGNIPYYLTSHLIRTILEEWPRPAAIVLMIQKEVAQRIVALPPKLNLLALSIQFYGQAKIIRHVAKGNFRPAPKVDSSIIKIIPEELSAERSRLVTPFFRIIKAAFSGKRKQLINSLSSGLSIPKTELEAAFQKVNIDSKRRPESLNIQEWLRLTSLLSLPSLVDAD